MTNKILPNILRFNHKDMFISKVESKFQGFFTINEIKVKHKLFEGGESKVLTREIFERGDAVVLMPYDPVADTVVIIEQFRLGALSADTPWQLEFIAGMFGENEEKIAVNYVRDGIVYSGSTAIIEILRDTDSKPLKIVAMILSKLPSNVVMNLYQFIASKRYVLFGKKDSCSISDQIPNKYKV